jgi:hypothetical protein
VLARASGLDLLDSALHAPQAGFGDVEFYPDFADKGAVLEHLGVVVGEDVDDYSRVHRAALTGQQFQSPDVEPYYVLFEDFTPVKFYRRSLYDGVLLQGARFDGFNHVDDWVPQRLVTATGPNPLPR